MAFPFSHFPLPLLYTRFPLSSPLGNLDLCRLASMSFITQFLSTKVDFCPSQFLSWSMAQFPLVTVFYAETLPIKVLCLSWFYWANILLLYEVLSFSTLVWSWHPSFSPPPNSFNTDDLTLCVVLANFLCMPVCLILPTRLTAPGQEIFVLHALISPTKAGINFTHSKL